MTKHLPTQTKQQRRALATFDTSAISAVQAFVASLKHGGETLQGKRVIAVTAATARQFWQAGQTGSRFTFNRRTLQYLNGSTPVPRATVKAVAESAANEARFKMMDAALRLQQGKLSPADFAIEHNAAVKNLVGAESALARGGLAEMTAPDWERAEELTAKQYGYSRAFHEDIARGRYGVAGEDMGDAVLQRTQLYANQGRAIFENTQKDNARDRLGHDRAMRVKGAVDSCPTCIAEGGVWRAIEDVVEISDSECGANCHCVIVTSVEGNEFDS